LAVICFAGLREPVTKEVKMAEKDPQSTAAAAAAAVCHYITLLISTQAVSSMCKNVKL